VAATLAVSAATVTCPVPTTARTNTTHTATTAGATVQISPDQRAREAVVRTYRAHLRAMTDGDTDALDDMLDDGFTLTHMTGYVQPKDEWLAEMRAGQFIYHDAQERTATVAVDGDTARLVGRIVTDATVYGTRASWRLQLTMDYARRNDTWTALRSVATTW
jgi:hypothetical protein